MQRTMFFKKFLMPCGLCAAVPIMKPVNPPEEQPKSCCSKTESDNLIRPSNLPIYSTEAEYSKEMPCTEGLPTVIEENIRKVRIQLKDITDSVSHQVSATIDNFKYMVDYLQDQANFLPRVGAVGIGGLSGLIFGLRGNFFKKLLYSTTGAGAVGVVCFPKEAKEAYNVLEHYGQISYNFIYGVKPGDSKEKTSFKELPLFKSVLESEYFELIKKPFEKLSEMKEEKSPSTISETKKE